MGMNPSPHGRKNGDPARKTRWTIMLYIVADDVLTNFAVESLKLLNESVSPTAVEGETAEISVAAQFAFPCATGAISASGAAPPEEIRRYIFKQEKIGSGEKISPLAKKLVETNNLETAKLHKTAKLQKMANVSQNGPALKDFLNWVYNNEELKADRYALVLWGHGPELLLQPAAGSLTSSNTSMYITPQDLREALEDSKPRNGDLEIVGFDACFMSMFEMACELEGLAKYMVASQDEVPDASFPYNSLVELFRKNGGKPVDSLLKEGLEAYVDTYKDCICDANTGMRHVTLSVLDLANCDSLKRAVGSLVDEVLKAKDDEQFAKLLIKARASSTDYAGGLYVDLHDFCENLSKLLTGQKWGEIQDACETVTKALTKGTSNLILDNSHEKNGHGISIYLPYLTDQQYAQVSKPLVKGGTGTRGGKGYTDMLNGAATEYLMCARRSLILDTESYYPGLQLAEETCWYRFIAEQWTDALIKNAPADLDYHYSTQQALMNVSRARIEMAKPQEKKPPLGTTRAEPAAHASSRK